MRTTILAATLLACSALIAPASAQVSIHTPGFSLHAGPPVGPPVVVAPPHAVVYSPPVYYGPPDKHYWKHWDKHWHKHHKHHHHHHGDWD
jgi:hypothetical protein